MTLQCRNLKHDIMERWTECADGYSLYIQNELSCFKKEAWTEMILKDETKEKMNILDIGTGPGFFPIILSKQNHKVTGIDCTADMINRAEANAEIYNAADVELYVMDCHNLKFEDNKFDMIVTRNVTWTLYDPDKAYSEWKRVLKPHGRLMIFDAEWQLKYFDKGLDDQVKNAERKYREKYGESFKSYKKELSEDFYKSLPLSDKLRPQWDADKLKELGFTDIDIDFDIIDKVYDEKEKLLYGCTPLFKIRAVK